MALSMPVAMHMPNELLHVGVAGATLAVAAGVVALAARRSRRSLDAERLPLMGVMGAFVFAAQMVNFPLPGAPISGHLGGGVLLAILLGPAAAIVTMAGILIVQCLLFQDGGLLALGCNIINMGVVPSLLGWFVYRRTLGDPQAASGPRQYLAAWLACMAGVTGGAALVPLEAIGGPLRPATTDFFLVVVGVHLPIAFVEGLITFTVLAYLRRVRPAALGLGACAPAGPQRMGRTALAVSIAATSLLISGVLSLFASQHPDGLEWAIARVTGQASAANAAAPATDESGDIAAGISQWQDEHAPMKDYNMPGEKPAGRKWVSRAGLIGTGATLAVVLAAVWLIRRPMRRRART